jgi:hypothetical protein
VIDPANRLRAGVGEMFEIELEVDLVTMAFRGRNGRLRRCCAEKKAQKTERENDCC